MKCYVPGSFIAPWSIFDFSNESQFRDVYRFFSISLPKVKLDRLCFRVIMERIVSVIFLFCIFARKLISAMAYRDISMQDMLRKHSYLSEVIFAGSLQKSPVRWKYFIQIYSCVGKIYAYILYILNVDKIGVSLIRIF